MTDIAHKNNLAVVPQHAGTFAAVSQPRNYAEAMQFCAHLSKSSICPKALRGDPMAVLVAIQAGERHGFDVLGSIQNICVINGKPSLYGDALLGACRSSSVFESIEETFSGSIDKHDAVATCVVKRKGDPNPVRVEFSWAMAKRANLLGKQGSWQEYPERMLAMRARGWALRNCFPDVLSGLISAEEAEDFPVRDAHGKATTRPTGPVLDAAGITDDTPCDDQGEVLTADTYLKQMFDAATEAELDAVRDDCKRTIWDTLSKEQKEQLADMRAKCLQGLRQAAKPRGIDAALEERKAEEKECQ